MLLPLHLLGGGLLAGDFFVICVAATTTVSVDPSVSVTADADPTATTTVSLDPSVSVEVEC